MTKNLINWKQLSFTISLALVSLIATSQIISDFQKDEKGAIIFSEVVKVDSADKAELFIRAKSFFSNTFKSGKDVLQLEDKENGIIMGKALVGLCDGQEGISSGCYNMFFSLKITVKDGRYKYEIYNITFRTEPSYPSFPEGLAFTQYQLFDSLTYYRSNGNPKPRFENIKNHVFTQVEKIKKLMFAELIKPSGKKEEW